jgi:hypothetical protein
LPALQAWATEVVLPHWAQSLSVVHGLGHLGTHASPTHWSVVWHALESIDVHATQWPVIVSQTWWSGSQATQSALDLHAIMGPPLPSVGHVAPEGAQTP